MQSTTTRQSQDHQGRLRDSCGAARARDPHMSTAQPTEQAQTHDALQQHGRCASAGALCARSSSSCTRFADARSRSPCCRRRHSRMMPGLRSSSQLAPSKLIAPSSPPCTAPPLALPVWPAWTASREREGGAKRLKASDLAVPYQTPQRKAPFDLPATLPLLRGIETTEDMWAERSTARIDGPPSVSARASSFDALGRRALQIPRKKRRATKVMPLRNAAR